MGRFTLFPSGKISLAIVFLFLFEASCAAQQPQPQASDIASAHDLQLSSPLDYEVFQRQTKLRGNILIRGHVSVAAAQVEARLSGHSLNGPLSATWRKVSVNSDTGDFTTNLTSTAGGFYSLEVRAQGHSRSVETLVVPHVGIGEVFIVSGQSNSTNYGETLQVTETRMVTTFDGSTWRIANDPQPGVQDNSKKGSFIPPFGDALYRRYGVPIGVASVGHGSTSVRQWLPAGAPVEVMPTMTKFVIELPNGTLVCDGTLFKGMMARIEELGPHGFRALLWHQGESDAHQAPAHEISAAVYRRMLAHIILETRRRAGWDIPWIVAQASYHTPNDPSCPPIREAQQSLWTDGLAIQGPDTDTLTSAFRQNNGKGTHFNDAGLRAHGLLWAENVEAYLDPLLH